MPAPRRISSLWLVVIPDVLLLYLSLWLAIRFRYPEGITGNIWNDHLNAFSIIFAVWLVVFFIHGLFDTAVFRRFTTVIFNLVSAMVVNFVVAITYFYFQPNLILTPRRFLLYEIVISFVLLLSWHLLVKYFIRRHLVEGVYLFSFDAELQELEREIRGHAYLGFTVLGHLNQDSIKSVELPRGATVILPDNVNARPEVATRLYQLRTLGTSFHNHKDFYEDLLRRVFLSELNEVWFLENINYTEKRFYNIIKRVVDIASGIVGFFVFLLTLPVCAVLIKAAGPGPVLFVQERVGKGGKIFKVYKYRTMTSWGTTNTWTSANDPRITKVGKFLRKSRIDELPQSINLLLGNMSLVGPRPEQPKIVEELNQKLPFYDERHLVKPGITGWAQINNIYASSLEETRLKLQYDLYYIKHRSFLFDLEIILKTLYYIFTWQGR
jgi:exopolysaccharide biosynthesis polyprenyl glycosylphosphotransferase